MTNYSQHVSTKSTPQTSPIPGSKQIANNGGGFSFEASLESSVRRFLILGSAGGSYYASEQKLTQDNASKIVEALQKDGVNVVNTIVDVSVRGLAPKKDPAIFALALACQVGDASTKQAAYAAISKVCTTGTHLFTFCQNIQDLRGWSRGLRSGVAQFYERDIDKVAMQAIKYRQRNGWTHKDVLRLAHVTPKTGAHNDLFKYIVGKGDKAETTHDLVRAFETAIKLENNKDGVKQAVKLITENKLPWEALPTEMLNNAEVWAALLPDMGGTALLRNLNKMTALKMFDSNMSGETQLVLKKLTDSDFLRQSKLHPLNVLNGMKTYESGHGLKGSLTWSANARIVAALDDAFYKCFGNVNPSNKNTLIGLDISGSMTWSKISNTSITPREASAAMCMVQNKTESKLDVMAFATTPTKLNFAPNAKLNKVIADIQGMHMGGTDCSLPMKYAIQNKLPVETFIVYTDSDTNSGHSEHPSQALKNYRKKTGIDAKLIVVGMVANNVSIADPSDKGMLDVVGFDTSAPELINMFSRGEL